MIYSNIKRNNSKGNRRASYALRLDQTAQVLNGNRQYQVEEDKNSKRKSLVFITNNPLAEINGIINNERPKIDYRLPSTEEINRQHETKYVGNSWYETIELYVPLLFKLFRFFCFYLVGIIFYKYIEHWSFVDCVYFITYTMTTVGYGNIAPKTKSGQIFTMFYIYVGILLVFSVIGDILNWFIMSVRSNYKKQIKLNKLQVFVRSLINCFMWIIILFTIPILGAIFFTYNEDNWTFEQALYFAIVTASSAGYGDINPSKPSSIWFNCFFIVFSVSFTALALEKISSFKRHLEEAELWQILDEIEPSKALLEAINPTGETASEAEFVLHMLQLEGKLDYINDLARWKEKFKEFDLDRDGFLTMNDCANFNKVVKRRQVPSRPHKKKSFVGQVAEETRDVFLETIGRKQANQNVLSIDEKVLEQQQNLSTPKTRARNLKRASSLDMNGFENKKDIESHGVEMSSSGMRKSNVKDVSSSSDEEEEIVIPTIKPRLFGNSSGNGNNSNNSSNNNMNENQDNNNTDNGNNRKSMGKSSSVSSPEPTKQSKPRKKRNNNSSIHKSNDVNGKSNSGNLSDSNGNSNGNSKNRLSVAREKDQDKEKSREMLLGDSLSREKEKKHQSMSKNSRPMSKNYRQFDVQL